jgi:hypothetical protein
MKLSALIIAVGMAYLGSANATTTSFNFNSPVQTTDFTYTGSLGKFNSSLGTLTGATLTLTDTWNTQFVLTNTAATASTFRYSGSTDLSYNSTLTGLDAILAGQGGAFAYNTGAVTLASGASRAFGPLTDSHTASLDLASLFGALSAVGGGTFNIACSTLSGTGFVGGGNNITANQQTNAGCGASIAYTYTATPPASVPVPGLGLAGFAAARRRKA